MPLALAACLALTASACMSPAAKQSTAAGAAGQQTAKAGPGSKSGEAESETAKRRKPWWRKYIRPGKEPMRPGDLLPGQRGLFSGKDGEIVLFRKGEAGRSSDPNKPTKVKR